MEIINVEVKPAGTAARRVASTTSGLVSAYQRTGMASQGVSAVATTGGEFIAEVLLFPMLAPVLLLERDLVVEADAFTQDEADIGYRLMGADNQLLAEEHLPIALESWPSWKE
jgi:hypothetical protein